MARVLRLGGLFVVTFDVGRDDGGAIPFAETLELCEEIIEK